MWKMLAVIPSVICSIRRSDFALSKMAYYAEWNPPEVMPGDSWWMSGLHKSAALCALCAATLVTIEYRNASWADLELIRCSGLQVHPFACLQLKPVPEN